MKPFYFSVLFFVWANYAIGQTLPARIEAEAYTNIYGTYTQICEDSGGGSNLAWMNDGHWAEYQVTVPQSGFYSFNFRVANGFSPDASLVISTPSGSLIAQADLPTTGGMQSWKDVRQTAYLVAGTQTIRMTAQLGIFSVNWIDIQESAPVPAVIEAEDFANAFQVNTEPTSDTGGGSNVGYIDDNDWMDYNLLVPQSGTYKMSFRVANSFGNGIIEIQNSTGLLLGQVNVPQTGGWQVYTTVETTVNLPSGSQIIRLFANKGTFNFNWFEVASMVPQAPADPYIAVPAVIEAENFSSSGNINLETTTDVGGGSNIAGMADSTWADYRVLVPTAGMYTFNFRIGNGYSDLATIQVQDSSGTVLAQTLVPRTGGLQAWSNVSVIAALPAGLQTLRIFAQQGVFTLNRFEVTGSKTLPGRIEAEAYDNASNVGVEDTGDIDGVSNVSHIDDGDWVDYNVRLSTAGAHTFKFRVANSFGNGIIEIKDVSGSVLGQIDVPRTGGWQVYTTIQTTANLSAGSQVVRLFANKGTFNFNWFEVVEGGVTAKAKPTISFASLPTKGLGDADFELSATTENQETGLSFSSSDPSVVSVYLDNGIWKASIVGVGTAAITASQGESASYAAADDVMQTIQVMAAPTVDFGTKIAMDPTRWYQLTNASNGLEGFFDGNTQEDVLTGWGKVINDYEAYYPLLDDEQMTLKAIKFFDLSGSNPESPMTVSVITDSWERKEIASFKGLVYNGWVGPYPDRNTAGDAQYLLDTLITNARYLVIKMSGVVPTEIEFYGSHTASTTTATPVSASNARLGDMFGVNGYEWNFEHGATPWELNGPMTDAAKSFTGLRHYMDWEKLEAEEGVYSFAPTLSGGWNYDKIYEFCKQQNISVLACLKTLPGWMLASYPESERDSENVPVRYGNDFADPPSYMEQARIGFQYAARYGSNTQVDPTLLSVHNTPRWTGDTPNTVRIGLDYIEYIECDNERDKWWKGRKGYQTAREYAANLSAFYDGHKNTMGPAIGIKNADPNMKVVIAGLVTGPDYLKGMVDWCKEFRGYKPDGTVDLCWDIVNFHLYTDNTSSAQSGTSTRGAAIETTNAGATLDEFLEVSHQLCYDMPVWITETGFDVSQTSPIKAIPIGSKSALDTQADWILRTALFSARKGIEKVFFYQMYDDNDGGGMFGSSGLLNGDQTRRPAADFLYQVNKVFGDFRYQQTLSQDPIVDQYTHNDQEMYVLTVPDEIGRSVSHVLSLGGTGTAQVYRPVAGANAMSLEEVPLVNGNVTLTVTETPMFVMKATASSARIGLVEEPVVLEEKETPALQTEVNIFPNPASDYMEVDLGGTSTTPAQIRVFNGGSGRLHMDRQYATGEVAKTVRVDLRSWPVGVYVVEVQQGSQRALRKLIIQH
ncbi:putative secreted protein (Por secretion system target) [Dyadobacter jejuensis]|uniref:Putative secreted protein (Por secretion system target) n=1 Tax=Dyadobacter jejuensis TaxID=1082580 RepID=A0A316ATA3_9BACT|nr:carbohydrate-binding protein [Dyadobacter jejuensis]PWJ53367.1 putative secreted protein (Por secretion system target) [Dyadobacter jejuensis]